MNPANAKTALIIPDCHIPYECKESYQLMLDVASHIRTDRGLHEIVILGDYADFYAVNSHGKDPAVTDTLIDEVYATIERLKELNKLFPEAKKIFIQGNHEYRLERYIKNKCPELFGVTTTDKILELNILGYDYISYGPNQYYPVLGSHLLARHEPISGGVHVAHGTVVKALKSVIFGHTHRIQESQIVTIDGQNLRGISSGWLGDEKNPVFNYVKNHHQWAQGFSVVTVLDNGMWFNQLVHIIDGTCVFDGYVFSI